jgi:hypothetical protein
MQVEATVRDHRQPCVTNNSLNIKVHLLDLSQFKEIRSPPSPLSLRKVGDILTRSLMINFKFTDPLLPTMSSFSLPDPGSSWQYMIRGFTMERADLDITCFMNKEWQGEVWGSRRAAPLILNFSTRWKWAVSFMPRPLYPPRKGHPRYPLDRRFCESQSRSGGFGEEKNTMVLPGIKSRFLGHLAPSPPLYWLNYPGYVYKTALKLTDTGLIVGKFICVS